MSNNQRAGSEFRIEKDALGEVKVPAGHLWGAQTERSVHNFPIGLERYRWGRPVIRALGVLKKCAALANRQLGELPVDKVDLIVRAAQEVIDGKLDQGWDKLVALLHHVAAILDRADDRGVGTWTANPFALKGLRWWYFRPARARRPT